MSNIIKFPYSPRLIVNEALEDFARGEPISNVMIISDMGAVEKGLLKISWANLTGQEALILLEDVKNAILEGAFITQCEEVEQNEK